MSQDLMAKDTSLMRAELDIQISTAKAYPRDIERFLKEAEALACLDEETAESCIYSLPRGKGKDNKQEFLKGESVRLAEIMTTAYGNIHAAARIIENDGKTITAEGAAWDLEKNVRIAKQVKRSIVGKFGTFSADMQVVTGNAASSIALRNAIFSVIPRAFVKTIYDKCVKKAIGDQTKLTNKIKELFERFKKYGIDPEKILAYFEKKSLEEITLEEVQEMIGIGTALKDGSLPIEKAFIEDNETMVNPKAIALEERIIKKLARPLVSGIQTNTDESNEEFAKALDY